MTARLLTLAAAIALVVGGAGAALAASPGSASIGPGGSISWTGQSYLAGATASPSACGVTNTLCDHFALSVGETSTYWSSHTGGVTVSITWASSSDNFDLYLYKGSALVGSSARSSSTSESVFAKSAAGSYSVLVVPKLVSSSGYTGHATFSSTVISTGGGGSGGGGSGSGGSGGSGGTGGSGGSGGTGGSGSGGSGGSGSGGSSGTGTSGAGGSHSDGGFSSLSGGAFGGVPSSYFGSTGGYTLYPGAGAPNYIGGSSSSQRSVAYQPIYGSNAKSSNPRTAPVAVTIPMTPQYLWLVVPLGLLTFAAVLYVVFEPVDDVLYDGDLAVVAVSEVPPGPPIELAGVLVRGIFGAGRLFVRAGRWFGRRRRAEAGDD